jgi:hypothetical protein
MDGTHPDPGPHDRPLSDHVAPDRTGSATQLTNAVAREMGADVAAWRWARIVGMAGMLQREAEQREQAEVDMEGRGR